MTILSEKWPAKAAKQELRQHILPRLRDQPFYSRRTPRLMRISAKSAVLSWGPKRTRVALKIHAPKSRETLGNAKEYALLRRMKDLPEVYGETPVIEPLAYFADTSLLVTRWNRAQSVRRMILRSHAERDVGIMAASRWLRAFHTTADVGSCPFNLSAELAQIGRLQRQSKELPAAVAARLALIWPKMERIAKALEGTFSPRVQIHGDATPSNFLFDGKKAVGLDLAGATYGDAVQDVACMMVMVMFDVTNARNTKKVDPTLDDLLKRVAGAAGLVLCRETQARVQLMFLRYALQVSVRRHANSVFVKQRDWANSFQTALHYVDLFADTPRTRVWFQSTVQS